MVIALSSWILNVRAGGTQPRTCQFPSRHKERLKSTHPPALETKRPSIVPLWRFRAHPHFNAHDFLNLNHSRKYCRREIRSQHGSDNPAQPPRWAAKSLDHTCAGKVVRYHPLSRGSSSAMNPLSPEIHFADVASACFGSFKNEQGSANTACRQQNSTLECWHPEIPGGL